MGRKKIRKKPEVGYQPKNRTAKTSFARKDKNEKLDQRKRILIVCEDSVSCPQYLNAMINDLGLSGAKIVIVGDGDSAPTSVYKDAVEIIASDLEEFGINNGFDQVYCVFDKDQHADYERALVLCNNHELIVAIESVPCFETWLLLHFEQSDKPYKNGEQVCKALKMHITDYDKNNLYAIYHEYLKELTETALRNADTVNKAVKLAETDNPSTKFPDLIRALQKESTL